MSKIVLAGEMTVMSLGSTAVGQLLTIDKLGAKRAKVATTCLGETVKSNRLSNYLDVEDTVITVIYNPSEHGTALRGWLDSGDVQTLSFAVTELGGTPIETYTNTAAYCTGWSETGFKEDGNIELEITVAYNADWSVTGDSYFS
jgi:hypothetical protein